MDTDRIGRRSGQADLRKPPPVPHTKMMNTVIEARGVSFSLSNSRVLDNIQFEVRKGQCLGIAGASGAGKTVLMRMLTGMYIPAEGELFVLNMNSRLNSRAIRARVGLMPERDGFEPGLTCLDALVSHGALYGIRTSKLKAAARELLRRVQLDEAEHWPVESLKQGQLRRLSLARAMVHEPEILLVDGPNQNLVSSERRLLWTVLHDQKQRGITIVIASRDWDELEKLCDNVMILDHGSLACQGPPEALISEHIGKRVIEYEVSSHDVEYHLQALRGQFQYQLVGDKLKIFLPEALDAQTAIRWVPSERVLYRRAYLKDVYVKLTEAGRSEP